MSSLERREAMAEQRELVQSLFHSVWGDSGISEDTSIVHKNNKEKSLDSIEFDTLSAVNKSRSNTTGCCVDTTDECSSESSCDSKQNAAAEVSRKNRYQNKHETLNKKRTKNDVNDIRFGAANYKLMRQNINSKSGDKIANCVDTAGNNIENLNSDMGSFISDTVEDGQKTNANVLVQVSDSPEMETDEKIIENGCKNREESINDLMRRAREYTNKRLENSDCMPLETYPTTLTNGLKEDKLSFNLEHENNQPCSLIEQVPVTNVNTEPATGRLPEIINSSNYNLTNAHMVLDYRSEYKGENSYTKGCKWSTDGSVLLVLSADQKFRLFNLPQPLYTDKISSSLALSAHYHTPALTVTEGELVYDYIWYPCMNSSNADTCRFVSCCRGLPVHMWDAWDGRLVCSYRPFNHLDEIAPTYSLGFSRDGSQLLCGFNKCIRVFNTGRPGRECTTVCAKKQRGIISCFDFHPYLNNIVAAGSYIGTIGLYNLQSGKLFSVLDGHEGGITQVNFSNDGTKLFTGARKNKEILCWDIRQLGRVLASYPRTVDTNQRIAFALSQDDKTLLSGCSDGRVLSWRLEELQHGSQRITDGQHFVAHNDCVNGISLHPHYPLLASSSGQRRQNEDELCGGGGGGTVRLWWLGERTAARS